MILNIESQTELSGFYIIYEGSTNFEKEGIRGISHLMEHLMCKSFEHLENDFHKDGINYNAYTSNNEVVYFINGLDEQVSKYRKKVLDLITGFIPTEEQFLHEKNIVIEEYMDYFNNQTYAHYLNLYRKLFNDYDPIGSLQDLESMTYQDMVDYIKEYYMKPSKIINVSKNSPFEEEVEFNKFDITNEIKYISDNKAVYELGNQFKDKSSIIMVSPIIEDDFNIVEFITMMLGHGLQSPLYQEVREKRGLSYGVSCGLSRQNNKGIVSMSVLTSNDNIESVKEAIKLVLDNPDTYLTEERFEIVKNYSKIQSKKSEINRYSNIGKFLEPKGWLLEEILDTITLDKVKEVFNKYLKYETLYISVDKEEFTIENVFNNMTQVSGDNSVNYQSNGDIIIN